MIILGSNMCLTETQSHDSQGSHSHQMTTLTKKHQSFDQNWTIAENLKEKDGLSTENEPFEILEKTDLKIAALDDFRGGAAFR